MATPLATPWKKNSEFARGGRQPTSRPDLSFSPSSIGGVAMVAMVGINAHQRTSTHITALLACVVMVRHITCRNTGRYTRVKWADGSFEQAACADDRRVKDGQGVSALRQAAPDDRQAAQERRATPRRLGCARPTQEVLATAARAQACQQVRLLGLSRRTVAQGVAQVEQLYLSWPCRTRLAQRRRRRARVAWSRSD